MSIINDALKKVQESLDQRNLKEGKDSLPSSQKGLGLEKNDLSTQESKETGQNKPQTPEEKSVPPKHPDIKKNPADSRQNHEAMPPAHGYGNITNERKNINETPPPLPPTKAKNDEPSAPRKKTPAIIIVFCFIFLGLTLALAIRLFNQPQKSGSFLKPQKTGESSLAGLELNGIMIMPDKNVALINGEIYEVGNKVKGLTIEEITLHHVKLSDQQGMVQTLEK